MKQKILFLTLLTSIISGLKADFFAYQTWTHPHNGQKIHEFYDIHCGKDQQKTDIQQAGLIQFIKNHQGLAIVEDRVSALTKQFGAVDVSMITPLIFLETACQDHGIRCINVEDNENRAIVTNVIAQSKDLDQNLIDAVKANASEQHIVIAAGADHFFKGLNKYLENEHYKPGTCIIGKEAAELMEKDQSLKNAFERFIQVGSTQLWDEAPDQLNRLIHFFTDNTLTIETDILGEVAVKTVTATTDQNMPHLLIFALLAIIWMSVLAVGQQLRIRRKHA